MLPVNVGFVNMVDLLSLVTLSKLKSVFTCGMVLPLIPSLPPSFVNCA